MGAGTNGGAIGLKPANRRLDGRSCRFARAIQILREGLLINAQPETGAPHPVAD